MKKLFIEIKEYSCRKILEILSLLDDYNINTVVLEKEKSSLISFNPEDLEHIVNILMKELQNNSIFIVNSINEEFNYKIPIEFINDNVYILDSVDKNNKKYAFNIKDKYFIDLNDKRKVYNYFEFLELCKGKNRNSLERSYELLRIITQLYYSNIPENELQKSIKKFYEMLLYSNIKVKVNSDDNSELYLKFKNIPDHPRLITWVDNLHNNWGIWMSLKNILNGSVLNYLKSIDINCSFEVVDEDLKIDVKNLILSNINTLYGSIILFTTKKYYNKYVIVYFPNRYCSISTLDKLDIGEDVFSSVNNKIHNLRFDENSFLKKEDITNEKDYQEIYDIFTELYNNNIIHFNNNYYYNPIFTPKKDIFSYFLTSIIP